jgi:multiple sugar transport system permease protein
VPFCAVLLAPFVGMFLSALKTNAEIFVPWDEFKFLPHPPQWGNFAAMWHEVSNIGRNFLNSAIIAIGSTMLALVAALPAAYSLARFRFIGRKAFLQLVLITEMFSPIVIIVGVYKMFAGTSVTWFYSIVRSLGLGGLLPEAPPDTLIDNLFGLILLNAAFNLAFAIWLLNGYFSTIPSEVEEAAWVDGCSWWKAMTRVMIPLAAPGIATAVIFTFIAAWNEFLFALTMLRTAEKRPVIVGLFSLIGQFDVQWNYIMAGALLAVVPVVVLFWLAEKHLVSGLTSGAIK